MKKLLILLINLATVIALTGCIDENIQNNGLLTIDIEDAIDSQAKGSSLEEFIDSMMYIPLETNRNISIAEIYQVHFYSNNFFVLDSEALYKFDSSGKFMFKIGNMGRGPHEYEAIRNFFIKSDTLYAMSLNKILAFSAADGSFLKSVQFEKRLNFGKAGIHFAAFNPRNNTIEYYNQTGKIIDSLVYKKDDAEILNNAIGYTHNNILFGTENSLKITTYCNDTIFEIDDDFHLTPKYVVNLGKYKMPDKHRPDLVTWDVFYDNSSAYLRKLPIETNNFLVVQLGSWTAEESSITMPSFHDHKRLGLIGIGIYDKRNNTFSLIEKDQEKQPCFYPNFSDGDNYLISYVNAIDAKEFYEKNRNKYRFNKSFEAVMQKLKIDDNPVLIMAKMKN